MSKHLKSAPAKRQPASKLLPAIGLAMLALVTAAVVMMVLTPASATKTAEVATKLKVIRPASDPLNVYFIGDSLTGNLHASDEAHGFRPLMVAALSRGGEVNERQGYTNGGTAGAVAGNVALDDDNLLAIVELGTNDVIDTPVPEFRKNYSGLLTAIKTASPDVGFLCVGTWQAPDAAFPYDTVIHEECDKIGGVFVALSDLHVDQANRGPAGKTDVFGAPSDNFHPNDEGYAAIAERLLDRLNVS